MCIEAPTPPRPLAQLLYDTLVFAPAEDLAGTPLGARIASEVSTARFVLFGGVLLGSPPPPHVDSRIPAGTLTTQAVLATTGGSTLGSSARARSARAGSVAGGGGLFDESPGVVPRLCEVFQLCVPFLSAAAAAYAAAAADAAAAAAAAPPGSSDALQSRAASADTPLSTRSSLPAVLGSVRARLVDLPTAAELSPDPSDASRNASPTAGAGAAAKPAAGRRGSIGARMRAAAGGDGSDVAVIPMPLLTQLHIAHVPDSGLPVATGSLAAPVADAAAQTTGATAAHRGGASGAALPTLKAGAPEASPPKPTPPRRSPAKSPPPPPAASPGTPRSSLDVEPIPDELIDRRRLLNTLNGIRVSERDTALGIAPRDVAAPPMFVAVGCVDFDGVRVRHAHAMSSVPPPQLQLRAGESRHAPFGGGVGDAVHAELLRQASAAALALRKIAVGIDPHAPPPQHHGSGGGTARSPSFTGRSAGGGVNSPGRGGQASLLRSLSQASSAPAMLAAGAPGDDGGGAPGYSPLATGGGGGYSPLRAGGAAAVGGSGSGSLARPTLQMTGGQASMGGGGGGGGPLREEDDYDDDDSAPALGEAGGPSFNLMRVFHGGGGGGSGASSAPSTATARHSLRLDLAQVSAGGVTAAHHLAGTTEPQPFAATAAAALRLLSQQQAAEAASTAAAAARAAALDANSDDRPIALGPRMGASVSKLSPRTARTLAARLHASPFGVPAPMVVVSVMSPLRKVGGPGSPTGTAGATAAGARG